MLEYVLQDNLITPDATDKMAHPVNVHVHNNADLVEELLDRNIGISKPEAAAAIMALGEIILKWAHHGEAYNGELTHIHFSIPGTFHDGEAPTKVAVRVTPSKALVAAAEKLQLKRVEPSATIALSEVKDAKTGDVNSRITLGGNATITGHNIKIAGDHESVGVWLDGASGSVRVPAADVVQNEPSRLIVVVPATLHGAGAAYHLRVVTQYSGGNKSLKEPKSCTLEKQLTAV
ncbi:MAG: DUF4469 domain-containing protein [Prevotellaceae bacterium]|nr:DUF4469 domain-containing protein [Prevotellaceae bacterium]